ncbi:hypothetical protein J3459_011987 [Metarhizium acridum]|nr:hypothetical protein J3459_011987 [Metarhizium acridum]
MPRQTMRSFVECHCQSDLSSGPAQINRVGTNGLSRKSVRFKPETADQLLASTDSNCEANDSGTAVTPEFLALAMRHSTVAGMIVKSRHDSQDVDPRHGTMEERCGNRIQMSLVLFGFWLPSNLNYPEIDQSERKTIHPVRLA